MLHLAVGALLAFVFAITLDLRVADATAISTNLYLSQFCAGCTALIDDTITKDLNWLMSIETTTHDFKACKYYGKLYCKNFGDNLSDEAETEITKSITAQLASEISDLKISVEFRDEYKEGDGCTDFESKFRDPRRVHEECDNVEPAPDYFEFVSVFTLTTEPLAEIRKWLGFFTLGRVQAGSGKGWRLKRRTRASAARAATPNIR